jgi:hypothetical protein
MAKPGPASTFSKALGARLCDAVANGASLNQACRQLGVPRRRVRNWIARYPTFGAEMAVAQNFRLDGLEEEILDLVDNCDGSSQAEVTKARAQADMRRWILSKARPAQFGEHQRLEHVGADGAALIPETDPTRLAVALHAVISAAAKKEGVNTEPPTIDHAPAPARRVFDPLTGQARLAPSTPAPSPASVLLNDPDPEPPAIDPDQLREWDDMPGRMTARSRQVLLDHGVVLPRPEPDRTYSSATMRPGHPAQADDPGGPNVRFFPDRANRRRPR